MTLMRLALLASVWGFVPACTVHHDDGSLALVWTVDNSASSSQCDASGAAQIRITVTDDAGQSAGTYAEACTAFSDTIALAPGDYTATAVLVDATGAARTTPITIEPFAVYSDASFQLSIDFPSSSFLSN